MTTCVHCDRSQQNHFKVIYEEEGNVYYRDCPIIKDGKRIGWHPTNRFTPRSDDTIHGKPISKERAYEGLGDPAAWKADAAKLAKEFSERPRSGEQAMSEKNLKGCGRIIQIEPDRNLSGICGICDGNYPHEHPRSKCLDCGTVGLSENMVGPVATHCCKSPATVQPEQPVLERYHIEPSGKMWVEHPPFKEPATQPAQAAGDHRQTLIAACRKAFEAIDAIPHGQTIRPSSTRHALREAWLACRDALQDIRTVDVEHTQPCSRCAELETALREIGAAVEKDFASTFPTYSYQTIQLVRQHTGAITPVKANAALAGEKKI